MTCQFLPSYAYTHPLITLISHAVHESFSLNFDKLTAQLTTNLTPFIGVRVQISIPLFTSIRAVFSLAFALHAKDHVPHSAPYHHTKEFFHLALLFVPHRITAFSQVYALHTPLSDNTHLLHETAF